MPDGGDVRHLVAAGPGLRWPRGSAAYPRGRRSLHGERAGLLASARVHKPAITSAAPRTTQGRGHKVDTRTHPHLGRNAPSQLPRATGPHVVLGGTVSVLALPAP